MWTISLPLAVRVSKKKEFILNLNRYRNAHFQVLSKAKVEFERVVGPRLAGVPRLDRCSLDYVYYHGKGQEPDTNNVLSVVDKFFCDTLVNCRLLEDDSHEYLVDTRFRYGGVDRENPRVDVTIRSTEVTRAPLPERKHAMKLTTTVTLSTADVQQALKDFLIKNYPQVSSTDNLVFHLAGDGSYEVRLDRDLSGGAQQGAQQSLTRELPSPAPQAVAPAGPPPVPSPVLVPGQSPSSASQAAPSGDELGHASAETPQAPAPGTSLFANLPRVSN